MPPGPGHSLTEDPLVLGLDEAGRGSLIGPLVVGGFLAPRSVLGRLASAGAADSKKLSPERRRRAYRELGRLGIRLSLRLDPASIDRAVREGALNRLEAEAFGRLARRSGARIVYADACDTVEERFGREVGRHAGRSVAVVARHHADGTYPIVGAASIVAKVLRDRAIERLKERLGAEFGSGYPSDRRTVDFVRTTVREGPLTPSWLRHSWATTERLKLERQVVPLESFDR